MQTPRARLLRHLHSLDNGVISLKEAVDACLILLVLADVGSDEDELIDLLPADVILEIRNALVDIRNQHYQWQPPLIGRTPQMAPTERLMHLDVKLNQS